jgi:hypothetical protein
MRVHTGPARVFEFEEEAIQALVSRQIKPGDVLVRRYEGPRANGMPEMYYATAILSADRVLNTTTAIVTDGRYSGAMQGARRNRGDPGGSQEHLEAAAAAARQQDPLPVLARCPRRLRGRLHYLTAGLVTTRPRPADHPSEGRWEQDEQPER